jgi:CRISPR system Cascade subunit CasD
VPAFLMFTLEAPLAAMGDIAVGERRYGADRPAKSAVLGIVAAALGIDRSDEASHQALTRDYGYAVYVDKQSPLLVDYHTVQAPAAKKGRRWATRRHELDEPDLGTLVSLRDYRAEARVVVALWLRDAGKDAPLRPLSAIADALRRPHYALYFGRKGCPLGRPPAPEVVDAATLGEALVAYDTLEARRCGRNPGRRGGTLYADPEARQWLGAEWREERIVRRRDEIVSRRRWQFGLRDELVAVAAITGGET